MASAEPPRALPLIFTAPGENTFQIGEEAVEFLQSIDRPVGACRYPTSCFDVTLGVFGHITCLILNCLIHTQPL